MQRVNWGANTDYEFIQNYKILQRVFSDLMVDKSIEVNRLMRGKYQDNLEFMQWLRKFYEINSPHGFEEEDDRDEKENGMKAKYDAVGRRNRGKGVKKFKPAQGGASIQKKGSITSPGRRMERKPAAKKRISPSKAKPNTENLEIAVEKMRNKLGGIELENKRLIAEKTELEEDLTGLERERDFYFNKLREVEVFLQNVDLSDENNKNDDTTAESESSAKYKLVKSILIILYKTDEDVDGFQAVKAAEAALAASKANRTAKSADGAPQYESEDEGKQAVDETVQLEVC